MTLPEAVKAAQANGGRCESICQFGHESRAAFVLTPKKDRLWMLRVTFVGEYYSPNQMEQMKQHLIDAYNLTPNERGRYTNSSGNEFFFFSAAGGEYSMDMANQQVMAEDNEPVAAPKL